ncbi:MAG: DUF5916 domain-containing protein [Gemmatimonadota bacterium]
MAVVLCAGSSRAAAAQSPERATLTAGKLTAEIRLDGRLDEAVWQTADSIAALTQTEPVEGAVPRGRTVVKILAGPRVIVIGIRCDNPPGVRIVSFSKARDAGLGKEDHVRLVFDTFADGRTGYVFAVNPTGSRYDALLARQGEDEKSDWDGIWEAATSLTPTGWSVEIRIPIKTLAFRAGTRRWRFNVQRRIQARQETDRWAGARRDWQLGQTDHAGDLVGLPLFDLGKGISIRPALRTSAGLPTADSHVEGKVDGSLDVTKRIGSGLLGVATVNTDFAETEVDARRINLTRFPLFFPEKRPFFLEGADLFDFGAGLGTDLLPFFTRRIGLLGLDPDSAVAVPLRIGGKLTGRVGGTRIGALVTRMGSLGESARPATLGAVRVSHNLLRESSVGALATFGDPGGRAGSYTLGADALFRTSHFRGNKNLVLAAWGLGMGRSDAGTDRTAVGAFIDYPNDLVDANASWKRIGTGFDPSLGFVPRPGVQILNLGVAIQPRPGRLGIRQMFIENYFSLTTDLAGQWQSYNYFFAPLNWRFESGDRFEANYIPQGERLAAPFEIASGVVIQPGAYRFTRYRLEVELANRRRVSGQLTWRFGGFYNGTLNQFQVESAWRPSAVVGMELVGEHDIARMPEGDFTTTLIGTRLRLNVSPAFQINSFVQWDSESRTVGSNTRLRWTIRPVAELFVVYNHNLRERFDRLQFDSNQLVAKIQYALQF